MSSLDQVSTKIKRMDSLVPKPNPFINQVGNVKPNPNKWEAETGQELILLFNLTTRIVLRKKPQPHMNYGYFLFLYGKLRLQKLYNFQREEMNTKNKAQLLGTCTPFVETQPKKSQD